MQRGVPLKMNQAKEKNDLPRTNARNAKIMAWRKKGLNPEDKSPAVSKIPQISVLRSLRSLAAKLISEFRIKPFKTEKPKLESKREQARLEKSKDRSAIDHLATATKTDCSDECLLRSFGRDVNEAAAIDAVTLVGGGAESLTFEDVAEVAIAFRADHFDAGHAEGVVFFQGDIFRLGGIVKRRPTATRIEFFLGGKQQRVATGAVISARALVFEFLVNGSVGALGAGLAEDVVLLCGELFFPLGIGLGDFFGGLGGDFWADFHHGLFLILGGARNKGESGDKNANVGFHGIGWR